MLVHVQEGEGIAILSFRVGGGGRILAPPPSRNSCSAWTR